MSTTFNMARSAFSSAAFAQLVRRLRHSNARYNQIAHQFRCRFRPTNHAKARARRAGLRIDVSKARSCPAKYISLQSLPVLDTSVTPSWSNAPPVSLAHSTSQKPLRVDERHGTSNGDAYMRPSSQRIIPKKLFRWKRRRDGRPRLVLRLPPLQLQVDVEYSCPAPFDGSVPGAPRLLPRQLPDDDEGDMEELTLGTTPPAGEPKILLRPEYSGLCITIPPRNTKRKLEEDGYTTFTQNPKRFMKARWDESQIMAQ